VDCVGRSLKECLKKSTLCSSNSSGQRRPFGSVVTSTNSSSSIYGEEQDIELASWWCTFKDKLEELRSFYRNSGQQVEQAMSCPPVPPALPSTMLPSSIVTSSATISPCCCARQSLSSYSEKQQGRRQIVSSPAPVGFTGRYVAVLFTPSD
jgi:hypothetical protein